MGVLPAVFLLVLLFTATSALADGETLSLRLLGTTDLHTHLVDYDYYKDAPDEGLGLARTATLIRAARGEARNTLLFDTGDTLQGNPLGDWIARESGFTAGDVHPMYAAMNLLGYDAASLGNHEFNYGLGFLRLAVPGARFPVLAANVFLGAEAGDPAADRPLFPPFALLAREMIDDAGGRHLLKVAVIGFVPPQIMTWDRANLAGKVYVRDIAEMARRVVPQLRGAGADLVVALAHSGFAPPPRKGMDENAAWFLTEVPGIDAVFAGHSHRVFPDQGFANLPNFDLANGRLNGVPAAMAGFWGSHLAVIDLALARSGGRWQLTSGRASTRPIRVRQDGKWVSLAAPDSAILDLARPAHEATLDYVRRPVGRISSRITSYFALVRDDPSVQLVSNAQRWFVERELAGSALAGLPVLSAAAPFKAGGRGGAGYYTDIPAGPVAIKNVADLYLYPNTLTAVVVTGAQVLEWLEMSALAFNQVDAAKAEPQPILNPRVPSYNFDVIDGVTYRIDPTQPARYASDGRLVAPDAHRVIELAYEGKPIDPAQRFVVATNNYRAGGGGNFPGLDGRNIVLEAQDTNQQLIAAYLAAAGDIDPRADGNWSLASPGKPVKVLFESAPQAAELLPADGSIQSVGVGEGGFALYVMEIK